ncbi:histone acetyltransferase MCC1 [Aristolochia californica]|uniref:histone acetyltransferase MCC1 n=1 Tax=Aristolochia californica TaxID=171875 RepID=UPI0035E0349F
MVDLKLPHRPIIVYRPIRPSDLEVLEQIHTALFPIRYEIEFFLNVVNGNDIISWGAVDVSRPDSQSDELIGFVTARTLLARETELNDVVGYSSSRADNTLVYILTLGVVEAYRNLGIATSLVQQVIRYTSSIPTCRAVYLHVIAYNDPAIHFYEKMLFKCVRRLPNFYYIKGHHYDSYLFIYYVNGGRSPCSPLDIVAMVTTYMRSLFTSLVTRLWKNDERKLPGTRWSKCKESNSLLTTTQDKRIIITPEKTGCQCV